MVAWQPPLLVLPLRSPWPVTAPVPIGLDLATGWSLLGDGGRPELGWPWTELRFALSAPSDYESAGNRPASPTQASPRCSRQVRHLTNAGPSDRILTTGLPEWLPTPPTCRSSPWVGLAHVDAAGDHRIARRLARRVWLGERANARWHNRLHDVALVAWHSGHRLWVTHKSCQRPCTCGVELRAHRHGRSRDQGIRCSRGG